eukprot:817645-Amphidinium_carterae.1
METTLGTPPMLAIHCHFAQLQNVFFAIHWANICMLDAVPSVDCLANRACADVVHHATKASPDPK